MKIEGFCVWNVVFQVQVQTRTHHLFIITISLHGRQKIKATLSGFGHFLRPMGGIDQLTVQYNAAEVAVGKHVITSETFDHPRPDSQLKASFHTLVFSETV